jgi:hypothetical protein
MATNFANKLITSLKEGGSTLFPTGFCKWFKTRSKIYQKAFINQFSDWITVCYPTEDEIKALVEENSLEEVLSHLAKCAKDIATSHAELEEEKAERSVKKLSILSE